VGGASGGTGGAVPTGGSGGSAGSFGGSGGSGATTFADCVTLLEREPVLEVEHPPLYADDRPLLAPSSDDGTGVSVAFVREPTQGTTPYFEADHVTLSPWGEWPTAPGANETLTSGEAFPALAVSGSFGDTFAVLSWTTGADSSFMPNVKPNAGGTPPSVPIAGWGSIFVAPGPPNAHLVGTVAENDSLRATVVQLGNPAGNTSTLLACGAEAGAVAWSDGWLVAAWNGAGTPGCDAAGYPGPPEGIDVLYVSPSAAVTPVAALYPLAPPVALAVASHSTGLYVVWIEQFLGTVTPVRWARVDAAGGVTGPFDLAPATALPLSIAVAALGDRLAVAWSKESLAGLAVGVALRDENGVAALDYEAPLNIVDAPSISA
jgi:hypothetical protein